MNERVLALNAGSSSLKFALFDGHSPPVRARICEGLGFLGLELNESRNAAHATVISADASRVAVALVVVFHQHFGVPLQKIATVLPERFGKCAAGIAPRAARIRNRSSPVSSVPLVNGASISTLSSPRYCVRPIRSSTPPSNLRRSSITS